MEDKERARNIIKLLSREYPGAKTALQYSSPLEILVATMLSAQSTDKTVNEVTKSLFDKYQKAEDYANADLKELQSDIKSAGFFRRKAEYLRNTGQILVQSYNSEVPDSMEELTKLPGVARKTANIVLSNAFGVIEGIAVDTHVRRLARRLALTENKDPNKIERDLMELVPKKQWPKLSNLLIYHGRQVCNAKKPRCKDCLINKLCPSALTFE